MVETENISLGKLFLQNINVWVGPSGKAKWVTFESSHSIKNTSHEKNHDNFLVL